MKKLLVLLMVLLVAAPASAIVDQDPDQMGFYFNLNAHDACIFDIAPFEHVPMYLLLTRPTAPAILGFECGFNMVGDGVVLDIAFANPQVIDVGSGDNLVAGFGEPTLTAPVTLLATFNVMYMGADMEPLEFYLRGSNPSSMDPAFPVIVLGDFGLQSVGISAAEGPTAQINGIECGVVATNMVSFEHIKCIYR